MSWFLAGFGLPLVTENIEKTLEKPLEMLDNGPVDKSKEPGHYSGLFQHTLFFRSGHNSQRGKLTRDGNFRLSPVVVTWAKRACILNKRTKFVRPGDTLAVCPRFVWQTFPTACHHCLGACSTGKRIRWHIWASAPEKYDAKLQ